MIKVLHIITDLAAPGGAETMLYRLLSRMDKARFENEVISLTSLGEIVEKIHTIGVRVRALGMKRGVPDPIPVSRLFRWISRSQPQIVQTWMYHANLIGGLTARLATHASVVWAIHHVNLEPHVNKRLTIWIAKLCASMSDWFPSCIVCCSQAAALAHIKLGYGTKRMVVIPNGLDLNEFKPDPPARVSVREELGIGVDAIVIGIAARFHVLKDYRNFVQAAARLRTRFSDVHFVMCGFGVTPDNQELARWIEEAGLQTHCHLLGEQRNIARLFAASDIATSSSLSEAFPLSVGEAMACGTPCVVTDVGDSALIVGNTGRVVEPRDPDALAAAWRELIEAGPGVRRDLGMTARLRVEQHFSLPMAVERYQAIYAQLAGEARQTIPSPGLTKCAE
jgi:glycosyltransferase involved in cell wall biosynthesis